MVKTPRTRHSSKAKEPVTIDLKPGEVSRVEAEAKARREAAEGDSTVASGAPSASGPAPGVGEAKAPPADDRPKAATPAAEAKSSTASAGPSSPSGAAGLGDPRSATSTAGAGSSSTAGAGSSAAGSRPGGAQSFGRAGGPDVKPAPTPSQASTRRGAGGLAAGVAGGVIALALGAGLQFSGLLPSASTPPVADQDPAIPAIEAQIEELRQTVAALPAPGGVDPALGTRLEEAEQRLGALTDEVERQRTELDALQAAPGEPGGQAVDLGPLEERIAAIETAIAALGGTSSPNDALAAVDEEIAGLRQAFDEARTAQQALAGRVDQFEASLSALAQRVDEVAEAPGSAIIIAASALKAAIDRGQPFANELETFAALAPDAPEIAELRALADSGVPTRAQIAAESDAAANAMIAASRPVDPEAGIIDRLWLSAMGLIQVRPIGMVEGEGVPENVARLDAAVTAGDYGRAIEEFETLPDDAKAAGEDFIARVRARHAADTLIDQALAAALRA